MPQIDNATILQAKQRFGIIGKSPALMAAVESAIRVAPIDLSVLVTGESGSGKEFFPKIIHQFGARKHKKYIAVNCGAIPEGTIDSELFGHEKGSFTGAISARKGYFEEANGGTLFLDEVAELPLTTQARLLRVLESGEFLKVGSSEVQTTDVRIVAATNVDLLDAVKQHKFREDLYYRLSTISIQVPNLHDRGGDDIALLARKFASDFSRKYMTDEITFSEEALHTIALYRWPGNVRQLKNMVEQLALFHAGERISRENIMDYIHIDHSGFSTPAVASTYSAVDSETERKMMWQFILSLKNEVEDLKKLLKSGKVDFSQEKDSFSPISPVSSLVNYNDVVDISQPMSQLDVAEKSAIIEALKRNNGNKSRTAKDLNISIRTLYRKIQEYEI